MGSAVSAFATRQDRASETLRILFLVVYALLMAVPGISAMPPLDRDEPRYLQATKQMVASGDLVDIRFQDQSRYKKPIGIYWLQAAAVGLSGLGEAAPIWVYRLVSTLAVVMMVLALYWTGRALFGPGAGLVAAVVLAGLFGVAFEGRIAKTDAMLVAFTVIAQGALAQIHSAARKGEASKPALPWIFWIAQGCGILVKGPISLLASLLTIVALSVFEKDWRWIGRLKPWRGAALMCLIVLPWLALITWKTGGAFLQESVGRDMLGKVAEGQESHGAPPGYFAVTFSLFFWPFGPMAIGAGLAAMNRVREHPALRFCLAWYVPFWLVFEAIPTKLPHYLLPAYPALALMIGWAATLPVSNSQPAFRGWQTWLWRLTAFGLGVATLAIGAIALGAPLYLTGHFAWTGIPVALLAGLAAWLALSTSLHVPTRRILAIATTAGLAYALFFASLAPSLTTLWLSPRVAEAVRALKPCATSPLAAVGYHEPSLVFLAGTATLLTDTEGAARSLLADPACALVVARTKDRAEIDERLAASGRRTATLKEIAGINYSSGDPLTLQLLLLEP